MNDTLQALDRTVLLCRDYVPDTVTDEQIVHALQRHVLITADHETIHSHSGQTALLTLVALLTRMGMHISVDVPDAALTAEQPPFVGETLHAALSSGSELLLPGATISLARNRNPDLVFIIGAGRSPHPVPSWYLTGTAWAGELADKVPNASWDAKWPIGAITSALLGACEAFKYAMRQLPLRCVEDYVFFEPPHSCGWDFDPIQLPPTRVELGHVDVVSAGAITQATLYSLLRLPGVTLHGRIFDDDHTAVTNLNRNMLTRVADVDSRKVNLVARHCTPNILLKPVPHRFTPAHEPLADRVLVGVDDIPSRWLVQRYAPGWVGLSGTSHSSISSSAHQRGEPCSACLHPTDAALPAGPIPTIAFVSLWAGLSLAVRLVREALQQPYPRNRQQLWLTPLRMDQRHAAIWSPVPPHPTCPAACPASRQLM